MTVNDAAFALMFRLDFDFNTMDLVTLLLQPNAHSQFRHRLERVLSEMEGDGLEVPELRAIVEAVEAGTLEPGELKNTST